MWDCHWSPLSRFLGCCPGPGSPSFYRRGELTSVTFCRAVQEVTKQLFQANRSKENRRVLFSLHIRYPHPHRNAMSSTTTVPSSLYAHPDPLISRLRLNDSHGKPILDPAASTSELRDATVVAFLFGAQVDRENQEYGRNLYKVRGVPAYWLQAHPPEWQRLNIG